MLITTLVLVAVIAFAAAVKPLADGKVGPAEALKFMALAMVPMLQYAMPFSAGFGATLAYHRLAQDNELTAAHAGGVSHRAVLAPALFSGVLLAILLALLTNQVIPRFLSSMERLITQDLAKILVANIERGESVERENMLVYADAARRIVPPAAGAQEQLLLTRMTAIELDPKGLVDSEATASVAHLWVFPGVGGTPAERGTVRRMDEDAGQARIRLERAVHALKGRAVAQGSNLDVVLPAPNVFKDDPKFLTFGELMELREAPERMNWVEMRRRDLAFHLGERMTNEEISARLARDGKVELLDEDGQVVRVFARTSQWDGKRWRLIPAKPGDSVLIEQERGDLQTRRWSAPTAWFRTNIGPDRERRSLSIDLEVQQTIPLTADSASATVRANQPFTGLMLKDGPLDRLLDVQQTPSKVMLELVRPRVENGDEFLKGPYKELSATIDRLRREIMSKLNERAAMSVACLVMVMSGAATAITLSSSLPLTVYLWSFFPALATVISISSGQQLTHAEGPIGLIVLWGGVVGFGIYALRSYVKLCRH
jgi:lipopolysaccharide export LptBFGC system permease protein LptF